MAGPLNRNWLPVALSLLTSLMLLWIHMRRIRTLHRRYTAIVACILVARNHRRHAYLARQRMIRGWVLRLSQQYSPRRWWVYPRDTTWWTIFVTEIWGDEQWRENFRMTRGMFMWLLDKLRHRIVRSDTRMCRPVAPDEHLAIALWYLANGTCYRLISQQFGVARSTICGIVIEVCLAIEMDLLSIVVCPGSPAEAMQGFEGMGFPHCVGAMDGTHVYIRALVNDPEAFVNRKKRHSVVMQATVNHLGLFVDVAVGNVGRDHDSHILRCSNIFDAMDDGVWVPGNPRITVQGVTVPALILADAGYPIRSWLMTPYGGHLNPAQRNYNKWHKRARNIVERAFGRLKMQWRCLLDKMYVYEENVNSVICTCVVLHNICECHVFPPAFGAHGGHDAPLLAHHVPPNVMDKRQHEDGEKVWDAVCEWLRRREQQ